MVVRKTPYYGAVHKSLLEIAKIAGEPGLIIRFGVLFESRVRKDAIGTMFNYLRMNLKLFARTGTYKHFKQFSIVKCIDVDDENVKVIKVYEKETKELIQKLDTLQLLL